MKTYFSELVPKIKRFSQRMDDCALLLDYQWVMISDIGKTTYIFRKNNDMVISQNGVVSRGKWEYLNHRSLLLESNDGTFLLSQEFTNDETLILSIDGSNNYAFFINESKFESRINSIDDLIFYLEKKYIRGVYISPASKYYYIKRAKEYGPYTLEVLKKKVKIGELNEMCFARHEGDKTYEQGVRVKDLLQG